MYAINGLLDMIHSPYMYMYLPRGAVETGMNYEFYSVLTMYNMIFL